MSGDPLALDGGTHLADGDLSVTIDNGAARGVTFRGVEVLRMIDYPVRDADWRTLGVEEIAGEAGPGLAYRRQFRTADGAFWGVFTLQGRVDGATARLEARIDLDAERATVVNRAGFVVLHPIAGVAGAALEVRHAAGGTEATRFPKAISPGQPVLDIAGLRHRIGPVEVAIAFEGEVFETEDQRNWTDASFKTYCRPLALPRPFTVEAGARISQRIVVDLAAVAGEADAAPSGPDVAAEVRMPDILLAHEPTLCAPVPAAAARLGVAGVLLRVDAAAPEVVPPLDVPVSLEIVTGEAAEADIARVAAACRDARVQPVRVVALPAAYLASHQPSGPWPEGPAPMDLVAMLRTAFPDAEVGGGALTNFTEFNRCRPDPGAIDFATFGTTAIVHAADDRSVLETLEALGDVMASARTLAGDRPLRLGLVSIGMRSNPYGAAVADNPDGARVPMAMDDPRQRTSFAAAWAVAGVAAAARGGVASLAPAMTGGPLGTGPDDAPWPIRHAVAALAALGGARVRVRGGPAHGLITLLGTGRDGVRGIAANLGPGAAALPTPDGGGAWTTVGGGPAEGGSGPSDEAGQAAVLSPLSVAILRTP